ncbi:hypothetical protein E2C01_009120 [Portunus trituberculatus]|uniref:Uncharacterized protein n=1 Tax=Portunus trituberculatus TaxID=210409 RepID=A0A5B7D3U0_PORTR|nr:hypothetical protein [Portunus trituberculatus]
MATIFGSSISSGSSGLAQGLQNRTPILNLCFDGSTHLILVAVNKSTVNVTISTRDGVLHCLAHLTRLGLKQNTCAEHSVMPVPYEDQEVNLPHPGPPTS